MKLKATITGEVHGVGYRVLLTKIAALEYCIDNFFAFNLTRNGEQAIICLLDAPDNIVKEFKERIKTEKPEKAAVESIEFEEYVDHIPHVHRIPPIERTILALHAEQMAKLSSISLK